MKVGIVTFHFVNNYGGALQAYALWRTIQEKCHADAVVIDYRNWFIRFTDSLRLLPVMVNFSEMKSGWKTMPQRLKRVQRFRQFIFHRCRLSRRYGNGPALCLRPPVCDKYVCGSDQIWNPYITCGIARAYFLAFAKTGDKFSYAPSFGISKMCKMHKKKIKKYLKSFEEISVREKEGCKLVKELTGREAVQLMDPVFLLGSEEWSEIAADIPTIKGEYILLYMMQRDERLYSYAKMIKERLGIQMVEISRYGYKRDFVDVCLVDAGPKEFVGLFQNATYICTNSYHGLAFSLIFEKDFSLIPSKKFGVRISSLLKVFHMDSSNMSKEEKIMGINYDKKSVRNIIAKEKRKAFHYLNRNIGGLEENDLR